VKVFISSVITGFEEFRDAAANGARVLRHQVLRAEDFGASPDSPQRVCLAGVRDADVVLLLLGSHYGQIPSTSTVSPTHEEFREAQDRCDVLVFEQKGVKPDPDQTKFLREVRDWAAGHYTAQFTTANDLREAVTSALHDLELSRKTGNVDEGELLERGRALIPESHGFGTASLCLVVVGAPKQQAIRPADLEQKAFANSIIQDALFGESPVLQAAQGSKARTKGNQLLIEQDDASILVDQLGSLRIVQTARDEDDSQHMPVLIEEEVVERLHRALGFAARLLDRIDPAGRLTRVAPLAALLGGSYLGWKTRAQHRRDPNRTQISMSGHDDRVVMLSPAVHSRSTLRVQARTLAEDLMVLLRRQVQS
jgi:Domain of unknown function (DUF4062)